MVLPWMVEVGTSNQSEDSYDKALQMAWLPGLYLLHLQQQGHSIQPQDGEVEELTLSCEISLQDNKQNTLFDND